MMPMFFLLIQRSLSIVQQAATFTLHDGELTVIVQSLTTVYDAIWARIETLEGIVYMRLLPYSLLADPTISSSNI